MKQTQNTAFTLVELIVVITILAVLATVAFISFQGYTSSSRDSVRLADLKNISKSFEYMKTKDQELPLPDQKVDITASGTIFQYQGVLEEQTLKLSNIHNGGLDPLTGNPYGYAVNAQRNKFQVIGFLENSQTAGNNIFSQSFADNTDKFVKTSGDEIGILLDDQTKEIIVQSGSFTQIDVVNDTNNYNLHLNNSQDSLYNQTKLVSINQLSSSCKQILADNPTSANGIYTIKPDGVNEMNVYCDMVTDGGGWTLVAKRRHSNGNLEDCGNNLNDFLHNTCNAETLTQMNLLDNTSYSLGEFGFNLHTSDYMVQQYDENGIFESDDSYIIESRNNLFPNSENIHVIDIQSICSLDKTQCDTTDGKWKYTGNNHFSWSRCYAPVGLSLGGMFGYCSNGGGIDYIGKPEYDSNSFLGNRSGYGETKLWGHPSLGSVLFQEFIYVR